jgi:hypothetical protein
MSESPVAAGPVEQPAAFEALLAAGQLPAWLPPVLATLHAGCTDAGPATSSWAHRLAGLLGERGPSLPFAVVHDWQARAVVPTMAAALGPAVPAGEAVAGLQRMHAQAAAGERFGEADWRAALEPVLRELYRLAYDYAAAYASAHASATAYARANDFSEQGAISFAESYATMSADANRDSFAEANAVANAAVLAAAYATGDSQAYAEAYPFALLQACAHACAHPVGSTGPAAPDEHAGDPAGLRRQVYARLADGLADSWAADPG